MANKQVDLSELASSAFERVVALEAGLDGAVTLFIRENDSIRQERATYKPFLLLANPDDLAGFEEECDVTRLDGAARYQYLVTFSDAKCLDAAAKHLKKATGANASSLNAPYRLFTDYKQQAMIQLGIRLFHGVSFDQVRRLQVDIETLTTPGFDFPNPERPDDRIVMICLRDNTGWEECLVAMDADQEKDILRTFAALIRERDPDIIEGHNLFRFDFPFIETRAKRYKVKLALGRNGAPFKTRNSRFTAAERMINYRRYDIYGRHVIDTLFLTQLYDVSHRDLPDYGLKSVARHFGVASPDRVYIDPAEIPVLYASDIERLKAYCLDDVRETDAISRVLSPSYFYQAAITPFSYQDCAVRGNATRIDAMLVDAYLRANAAIPAPEPARRYEGALTEAVATGVFKNVWHCDIRSLYPSIILAGNLTPSRDRLGVFPRFLKTSRQFRLDAKDREKAAQSAKERDVFNALQTSFKIMINSFYGYLGFGQGTFNDFDMAADVTRRGREILSGMKNFLESRGAKIIEMDTDGVYFQPPADATSPEAMEAEIQASLPTGIDVELDATFAAMFCYKSKNYATIDANGEIGVTGAALKSRGLEPFLRDYIKLFLEKLLTNAANDISNMTEKLKQQILNRDIPLAKLAKSETLKDSPELYKRKLSEGRGRRSAAYELAINAPRDYRQGDMVSYYVTGEKKRVAVVDNSRLLSDAPETRDENTAYYATKLDETHKKFIQFIPSPPLKSIPRD